MKTTNQAATEWAHANCYPKNKEMFFKMLHRTYKRGAEFAQQWISVEKELPEDTKPVIVKGIIKREMPKNIKEICAIGQFYKSGFISNTYFEVIPTHWRPIEIK